MCYTAVSTWIIKLEGDNRPDFYSVSMNDITEEVRPNITWYGQKSPPRETSHAVWDSPEFQLLITRPALLLSNPTKNCKSHFNLEFCGEVTRSSVAALHRIMSLRLGTSSVCVFLGLLQT